MRIKIYPIDYFTIIYFIIALTLAASSYVNTTRIILVLFCIWILIAFITNYRKLYLSICNIITINVLLYSLMIIFIGAVSFNLIYNIKISFGIIIQFSPLMIFIYYYLYDYKKIKKISKILLFYWTIICIYSIYLASQNSEIGRQVTSGSEVEGFAVGGVTIANGAVLIGIFLIEYLKDGTENNIIEKVYYLMIIIIQFYTVAKSGSTISIVCMVVSSIMILLSSKRILLSFFLIIFIILLFYIFKDKIGELIIRLSMDIENYTSSSRLKSLGYAIIYGDSNVGSQYFFDRINRPILSLKTFIENPIFGTSYQYGNYYPNASKYGIGLHGEWADALAKYGLFSLIFFSIFYNSFRFYVKRYKKGFSYWGLTWLMLGCFNPVVSIVSVTVGFFIIPGLQENISVEDRNYNEKNFIYKQINEYRWNRESSYKPAFQYRQKKI